MNKHAPSSASAFARRAKRAFRVLRKSVANSARAFRPDELGYRLAIGKFGPWEIAYREGTADEKTIGESFAGGGFFAEVPEYRPEPHNVIIDVGAHIGTFALVAATKVPNGKVHAVEASKETFNYLKINVALNRLPNVDISHLALSDRRGRAVLHYDEGNWGHSITKRLSAHGEDVETASLAQFMEDRGIGRCDFMKLNCEGAEFPILLGAPVEVLNRIRMMLVLYHCDLADGYSLDVLLRHLEGAGFAVQMRKRSSQRGWIIAEQTP